MDAAAVVKRLGVKDRRVLESAREYVYESKSSTVASSLGASEVARAACCVEIALRRLNLPCDRSRVQKLSCVREKDYVACLKQLQRALGREEIVDIGALAIRLGVVSVKASALKLLELYKSRFLQSLPSQRRGAADFSRAAFPAAALVLAALHDKLRVDKNEACEAAGVDEDDFAKVSNSMRELCFDVCGTGKAGKDSARGVKRHRDLIDATSGGANGERQWQLGKDERAAGAAEATAAPNRRLKSGAGAAGGGGGVSNTGRAKVAAAVAGKAGHAPTGPRKPPPKRASIAADPDKGGEALETVIPVLEADPAPPPPAPAGPPKKLKQSTLSFFKAASAAQR